MSDEQKVIFKQLQLAGLGIVIGVFGLVVKHRALPWIGLTIFVFGIIRVIIIHKLVKHTKDDES